MALYYLDASALVKYYVIEPGSHWVRRIIEERDPDTQQTRHTVLIAEVTRVEVAAGIAVIQRVGRIRRLERDRTYRRFISQLTHRYAIIPLTSSDLEVAANLTQQYPLKAHDAVQLAVALRHSRALAAYKQILSFVSGDNTLLTAAQVEGLSTENPFGHVSPQDTAGAFT